MGKTGAAAPNSPSAEEQIAEVDNVYKAKITGWNCGSHR